MLSLIRIRGRSCDALRQVCRCSSVPASRAHLRGAGRRRAAPLQSHILLSRLLPRPFCASAAPAGDKEKREAEKDDPGGLEVDRKLLELREELEAGRSEAERAEAQQQSALEGRRRPLRQRLWAELLHYYHGFRLFFADLRVSTRLLRHLLLGRPLGRAEKLQLVRSVADMVRLVPFLVFIVVPFMEFLLPVYLKLFPGALPSTFQERSKQDEKARRQLKVKLEMARFLQDTVAELSQERRKKGAADSKIADFSQFLANVRSGAGYVSNTQLLQYSKLFEDELTLDSLSEAQLRALCRIVGLTPLGTANILRFQLSMRLNELKRDDRMIHQEGVEQLGVAELQAACRARGMRALGVPEARLRAQLAQWLELSFDEKVPPSLLLLSRTLFLPDELPFAARIRALLPTLPPHLSEEAARRIKELEGADQLDHRSKFRLVKEIEEMLKRERESRRALQQATAQLSAQQQPREQPEPRKAEAEKVAARPNGNGHKNGQAIGDPPRELAMQAKEKQGEL